MAIPVLITVTLYAAGEDERQLCGPAFIKCIGSQQLKEIMASFARWVGLPPESICFSKNGIPLAEVSRYSVADAGLVSGNAIHAQLLASCGAGVELLLHMYT